jgi:hypothetical protein
MTNKPKKPSNAQVHDRIHVLSTELSELRSRVDENGEVLEGVDRQWREKNEELRERNEELRRLIDKKLSVPSQDRRSTTAIPRSRVHCKDCVAFDSEKKTCHLGPAILLPGAARPSWPPTLPDEWCMMGVRKD